MTRGTQGPVPAATFEFDALREARHYRAALLDEFAGHLRGRVLEVGAGVGHLTRELVRQPAVSEVVSIEPEPAFCAALRAAIPGHRVIEGTLADLPAGETWTALVSVNVLEHIAADERELRGYREVLAPTAGTLCLFVPARPELYAALDRDFGHYRRYTRRGLERQLAQAGFRILRLCYYNWAGYFAWGLTFRLLRRRGFHPRAVRWFDRFLFPAMNAFERHVVRPPFGQSLLAIARAEAHPPPAPNLEA
jgi:SAM-dependent methyltransferase